MDIQQQIRAFIVDNFYVPETSELGDDTSLIETGIVDSTGVLEVVAFLEREFGISISDRDIVPANLDTIARMTAFVMRQQAIAS